MSRTLDLDSVIGSYAAGPYQDATPLAEVGIVSLTIFRIITEIGPEAGVEIDVERLASVETVGDLKDWLQHLTGHRPLV